MKTTIYLFTILLALNACKANKETLAKEGQEKTQDNIHEMTDAEREEAIVEQMKNEKLPHEGEDYYNMVEKEIPADAVARIQRTPCFGKCPIYTLTIFENGKVEYFGQKFTPREGRFEGKVSPELIANLMNEAQNVGFYVMNNIYDKQAVTDVPSTITSLRTSSGLKTVVNRFDGPEELRRFEKYFDQLFNEVEWTAAED